MDIERSVETLFREMKALEMRIREKALVERRPATAMAGAALMEKDPPEIIDTHVGYFGIWE